MTMSMTFDERVERAKMIMSTVPLDDASLTFEPEFFDSLFNDVIVNSEGSGEIAQNVAALMTTLRPKDAAAVYEYAQIIAKYMMEPDDALQEIWWGFLNGMAPLLKNAGYLMTEHGSSVLDELTAMLRKQ
jgi:hypothetical protein